MRHIIRAEPKYIKECLYYEDSAVTFADIFIPYFEKDIWDKEGKEKEINSQNIVWL